MVIVNIFQKFLLWKLVGLINTEPFTKVSLNMASFSNVFIFIQIAWGLSLRRRK